MPRERKNKPACLYPPCLKDSVSRGLCRLHYNMARNAVRAGATSWERLETKGKARPQRAGAFHQWLAKEGVPEQATESVPEQVNAA